MGPLVMLGKFSQGAAHSIHLFLSLEQSRLVALAFFLCFLSTTGWMSPVGNSGMLEFRWGLLANPIIKDQSSRTENGSDDLACTSFRLMGEETRIRLELCQMLKKEFIPKVVFYILHTAPPLLCMAL